MTTRWSRIVHDLLPRGVVARRGRGGRRSGPSRTSADRWMSASRSWFRGTIQPFACRAFQIASPFSRPNASRNFCFSTSEASGPEPLAGGQVEEVAQQALRAEPRVALVLRAGSATRWARCVRACSRERYGRVGLAGDDVREQLHVLADRGQLGERAEEEPPLRVLVPALERIARDRVDHPVLRGDVAHRVVEQRPRVTVLGGNGREAERRLAGAGSSARRRATAAPSPTMASEDRDRPHRGKSPCVQTRPRLEIDSIGLVLA